MGAHPTGQDAEGPLMDVHDRVVLPLIAIHFLKTMENSVSGFTLKSPRRLVLTAARPAAVTGNLRLAVL